MREKLYPYTKRNESCKHDPENIIRKRPKSWGYLNGGDTNAVKTQLLKGPLSVAMNAGRAFQLYSSGIIRADDVDCQGNINHGIVMTGYHDDPAKPDERYYTLQNSWGKGYGDEGFVRFEIADNEVEGTCRMNRYVLWVA